MLIIICDKPLLKLYIICTGGKILNLPKTGRKQQNKWCKIISDTEVFEHTFRIMKDIDVMCIYLFIQYTFTLLNYSYIVDHN